MNTPAQPGQPAAVPLNDPSFADTFALYNPQLDPKGLAMLSHSITSAPNAKYTLAQLPQHYQQQQHDMQTLHSMGHTGFGRTQPPSAYLHGSPSTAQDMPQHTDQQALAAAHAFHFSLSPANGVLAKTPTTSTSTPNTSGSAEWSLSVPTISLSPLTAHAWDMPTSGQLSSNSPSPACPTAITTTTTASKAGGCCTSSAQHPSSTAQAGSGDTGSSSTSSTCSPAVPQNPQPFEPLPMLVYPEQDGAHGHSDAQTPGTYNAYMYICCI